MTYGAGSPRTLLVAGLDEPGYAVSGITDDGYLRLQRPAEPPPHYQFDSFFLGQPVSLLRLGSGRPLAGVVAAPSVHFKSDRGSAPSGTVLNRLFVDIGASSRAQAEGAGVAILDRVRLDDPARRLGPNHISGPWISSRAGAALLIALGEALGRSAPPHEVTLAFVTRQYFDNAGLLRVLRRTRPERLALVRPGGAEKVSVAPVEGWSSELRDKLMSWAEQRDLPLESAGDPRIGFGPFGSTDIWPDPQQSVVVTLGPENSGTPVEILDWRKLGVAAAVLAHLAGIDAETGWTEKRWAERLRRADHPADAPAAPSHAVRMEPWLTRLEGLISISGVSGDEGDVRAAIQARLPPIVAPRAWTDDKGNLIVPLGGAGEPRAIFIAHMDEIGFRVTRADADGRLALESRGGLDEDLFSWHSLSGPAILTRSATGWSPPGTMAPGASLTPPKRMRLLLNERISARSLDDRVGCAALLEALYRLGARTAGRPVWVVFSVEEETGLVGAELIANRTTPKRVYAVDSLVTSDSPLEPKRIAHLKLGAGPALRALDQSGLTPYAEVARLLSIAKEHGISLQVGVTAGGNDGSRFVASGAVNIPLSFPLRYSHTSAEVADLRDIRGLIDLLEALLTDELGG